jgi:hypothetical protein
VQKVIVPLYSKEEKKKLASFYIFPSTQKLVNVIKELYEFSTIDDVLTTVLLDYNKRNPTVPIEDNAIFDSPLAYRDIPVTIASDPDREMNRRKRKTGKSLDPDRRKVFEVGNGDFP